MTRATSTARNAESTAAVMTMGGRDATPNVERKSASRVALPASCSVIMTAAATAAADAARASGPEPGQFTITATAVRQNPKPACTYTAVRSSLDARATEKV